MPRARRIPIVTCDKLSDTDNLMFFVEQIDILIETFRAAAVRGLNLTVEQISEELLPPPDADLDCAIDHAWALAVSLAILIQRAVTG